MRTSQEKTNSNSPFYGCQLKKNNLKLKKKKKNYTNSILQNKTITSICRLTISNLVSHPPGHS